MATYSSVWSDVLCFRPSPSPLPPSSPIWLYWRLQRPTKWTVSDDIDESISFLSTEVGDKNNCNWEATERRLTWVPWVMYCASGLHLAPCLLHLRFCSLRGCKEQRIKPWATILMSQYYFCQPRWVTKISVTAKRRNGDLLELLEWCIVFQAFT